MQSIDSIETYAYEISQDLVSEKEEFKYNRIIERYKKWLTLIALKRRHKRTWFKLATNFWSFIQNTNISRLWIWRMISLFDLIIYWPDIVKLFLYAKDSYEVKYQFLINRKESTGLKRLKDFKALIQYSNDKDDSYKKNLKNTIQLKKVKC